MPHPLPRLSTLSPGPHARDLLGAISEVVVYQVPLKVRFRGVTQRNGLLLRGPYGWGECAPFWDYDSKESSTWFLSALESATRPHPEQVRTQIPLNATIPVIPTTKVRATLSAQPGCRTAKVKVADGGVLDQADADRVAETAAVLHDWYGDAGRVRIDANAAWTVSEAARVLEVLNEAANPVGGLEYAEQPCQTVEELAQLRRLTDVPIAADESIRRGNPDEVAALSAADVGVLKVAPLGGIRSALQTQKTVGLPGVVSSALDTSIGIAAGVQLAASLAQLDYACGLNTGTLLAADVVDKRLVSGRDGDGTLSVYEANQVVTGELTSRASLVDQQLVEQWKVRLEEMAAAIQDKAVSHGV